MSAGLFAILGIAPTTDLTAVKRAYFSALKLHPPHADPEGFRRLRDAYEALSKPGALPSAVFAAGARVDDDLKALDAVWDAPLTEARANRGADLDAAETRARFARWISAKRWDDVIGG
jgi:hypothetical protein